MEERTPEEWWRHAQSLRDAAEDGRKLGEAYRQMADNMMHARMDKWRKAAARDERARKRREGK